MSLPILDPIEFETLRSTLVSTYNLQTTAHVGYIIAFAVGIAAVLYQINFNTFSTDYPLKKQRIIFFYAPISALLGGIIYLFSRVIFWAYMSTVVLRVPITQVALSLADHANDPSWTEIWAIQYNCSQAFIGTHGLSSIIYSFSSGSLLNSFLVFLLFSIIIFVIFVSLDKFFIKKKDATDKKTKLKN